MNNAAILSTVSNSGSHKQYVVCEIQDIQDLPFLSFCASIHSMKFWASLVTSKMTVSPCQAKYNNELTVEKENVQETPC